MQLSPDKVLSTQIVQENTTIFAGQLYETAQIFSLQPQPVRSCGWRKRQNRADFPAVAAHLLQCKRRRTPGDRQRRAGRNIDACAELGGLDVFTSPCQALSTADVGEWKTRPTDRLAAPNMLLAFLVTTRRREIDTRWGNFALSYRLILSGKEAEMICIWRRIT